MTWGRNWPVLLLPLGVLACAYDPPVAGDRASALYQADLDSCRAATAETVDKQNAKTGLAWLASPFRRPFQLRPGVQACMVGKGYPAQG